MKCAMVIVMLVSSAILGALPVHAQKPQPGVHLTIHNNFALAKDRRELDEPLRAGLNIVRFRDVAATIDATSVHFRSLTDPSATVDEQNKKVNVLIEFENRAARNLGIALPAGKCRVYKAHADQSLEFIGEDSISHTPRDEKVTLYIGLAHALPPC